MSTVIILAGGKSSRMKRDKLELRIGEQSFLESAIDRFSTIFDSVYVSVADINKYPEIKAEKIADIYANCGPLAGLHTALSRTEDGGVFLVAADMPFATPEAAMRIIELTGSSDIGIVRNDDGKCEPLFGYYRKSVLPFAEQLLVTAVYRTAALFDFVNVRFIAVSELGSLWNGKIFYNVNYPKDYENLF